jgi:hypothetical protein
MTMLQAFLISGLCVFIILARTWNFEFSLSMTLSMLNIRSYSNAL